MKLSLAMATYNGEEFIKKQLQSIYDQNLHIDEAVISDDRSTDATASIIRKFIQEKELSGWKFKVNKENLGYAQNFINTVKETTGDIIFLCDQDDIWLSNKTEVIVDLFSSHLNLWMLHTDIDLIDENDAVISRNYDKLPYGYQELSFDKYARRLNYCGMASAFTADLRNALGKFDLTGIPTHDWILGAIACIEGKFATDNIVLTQRRQHSGNAELKENTRKPSKTDRIEYIELYNSFYTSLRRVLSQGERKFDEELTWLNNRIRVNTCRIECLKEGKFLSFLRMANDINRFPSKQAYISEARYYFR